MSSGKGRVEAWKAIRLKLFQGAHPKPVRKESLLVFLNFELSLDFPVLAFINC